MNTVGKTLVILNFLFAVIMGMILVLDVALRTNWKESYFSLKREAEVMTVSLKTNARATASFGNDLSQAQATVEKLKQELKEKLDEKDAKLTGKEFEVADLRLKLKDKDIIVEELKSAKQRLVDEIALLTQTVKDREGSINKLGAEVQTYRISAVSSEARARDIQARNEILLEQVRDLENRLARKESGVNVPNFVKNPNAPNPPSVKVEGKIERVDAKDTTLVEISVGTDQGVNKNHTLDVYRTQPEAKYLGMIRILDAHAHTSVGRLVTSDNPAFRPQLKQGDKVASSLTR
jgi:hypothetical protein